MSSCWRISRTGGTRPYSSSPLLLLLPFPLALTSPLHLFFLDCFPFEFWFSFLDGLLSSSSSSLAARENLVDLSGCSTSLFGFGFVIDVFGGWWTFRGNCSQDRGSGWRVVESLKSL